MSKSDTERRLLEYWVPTVERVGLVRSSGEIIELRNQSKTPSLSFAVSLTAILDDELAVAMWHTHPQNNVWLSAEDHIAFLQLPHLKQYIVTERRVRSFVVVNGRVLNHETHNF